MFDPNGCLFSKTSLIISTASLGLGRTIFSGSVALSLPPDLLRSIMILLFTSPEGFSLTMSPNLDTVPWPMFRSTSSVPIFLRYP